jgi:hypothetical protein
MCSSLQNREGSEEMGSCTISLSRADDSKLFHDVNTHFLYF